MAYDPKAYLQQALKSGFQPRYEPTGASPETGQETERYAGDEARFGDVVVRPLSEFVGQSEQDIGTPQQTGYSVDSPLGGQYQGWFRSDIYDNDGNFVRTAYVPPDNDKYGLKDLAQLGLTAASFGGLGATGQLISKGVSGIAALKSGDPLRILSAASNIPGAGNLIPAELKTLMDYAGKAGQVQSALKGDPNAIFGLITGAAKSGTLPKGLTGDVDLSGADAIEGFFEPGGEGYVPPDASNLPDWALDPYKTNTPAFTPSSDDAYEDIESLLARYTDQGFSNAPTGDLSQIIDVTGTRDTTGTDAGYTPRSIRDIGNVTQIQPGEKLEGTDITTPDLSKNLPTVPGKTTLPKKTPGKPTTQSGLDLSQLAFLLGMMQHRPKEQEQYQTAQWEPFDRELMYGLRG